MSSVQKEILGEATSVVARPKLVLCIPSCLFRGARVTNVATSESLD